MHCRRIAGSPIPQAKPSLRKQCKTPTYCPIKAPTFPGNALSEEQPREAAHKGSSPNAERENIQSNVCCASATHIVLSFGLGFPKPVPTFPRRKSIKSGASRPYVQLPTRCRNEGTTTGRCSSVRAQPLADAHGPTSSCFMKRMERRRPFTPPCYPTVPRTREPFPTMVPWAFVAEDNDRMLNNMETGEAAVSKLLLFYCRRPREPLEKPNQGICNLREALFRRSNLLANRPKNLQKHRTPFSISCTPFWISRLV